MVLSFNAALIISLLVGFVNRFGRFSAVFVLILPFCTEKRPEGRSGWPGPSNGPPL
jgi:hypothetical protein